MTCWAVGAVAVLFLAAYAGGVRRLARRGDRWPAVRGAAAAAAACCLVASVAPGVLARDGFPMSVAQHLVLASVAPTLLALSAPVTLALRTLPGPPRSALLRVLHSRAARALLTAPVVLALTVGGTAAVYATPVYANAESHPLLHTAIHAHMFASGWLFSAYVVALDPLAHRPPVRARAGVVVLAAASHDILAKLMYAHVLPPGVASAAETRAGAQLMFYGGDAVELMLLTLVLTDWYARSARARCREARASADPRAHEPGGGGWPPPARA